MSSSSDSESESSESQSESSSSSSESQREKRSKSKKSKKNKKNKKSKKKKRKKKKEKNSKKDKKKKSKHKSKKRKLPSAVRSQKTSEGARPLTLPFDQWNTNQVCSWACSFIGREYTRQLYDAKVSGFMLSAVISSDQLMSQFSLPSAPAMVLYRRLGAKLAQDQEKADMIAAAKKPLKRMRLEPRSRGGGHGRTRLSRPERGRLSNAIKRNKHWATDFMEM